MLLTGKNSCALRTEFPVSHEGLLGGCNLCISTFELHRGATAGQCGLKLEKLALESGRMKFRLIFFSSRSDCPGFVFPVSAPVFIPPRSAAVGRFIHPNPPGSSLSRLNSRHLASLFYFAFNLRSVSVSLFPLSPLLRVRSDSLSRVQLCFPAAQIYPGPLLPPSQAGPCAGAFGIICLVYTLLIARLMIRRHRRTGAHDLIRGL